MKYPPPQIMKTIPMPKDLLKKSLEKFYYWFFDSKTFEVVIKCQDDVEFRLFDFAEMCKFWKEDLIKLDEHELIEINENKEWIEAFKIMLKTSLEKKCMLEEDHISPELSLISLF
jgi:hypothetical protein